MKNTDSISEAPLCQSVRPQLSVVASTSQGARDYQEDAMGHWMDPAAHQLFAVVADGAGGHGGGAEASKAVIASAAETWRKIAGSAPLDPAGFLAQWMKEAHLAVNVASEKIHKSARSVVVACHTDGTVAHWVHAGDCRLLRFHEGKLAERTRDDSVVQVLFERGEITEEEMGTHPDQSRLLQSLGGEDAPTPRPGRADLVAGDVLILCSDGFWEHLKQAELEKLAATPVKKMQQALDQAVAEAIQRAGPKADNTTAMIIAFDEPSSPFSATAWYLLVFLVTLAGCFVMLQRSGRWENLKQLWEKWRQPAAAFPQGNFSPKPPISAPYE
jgi:serine/threonine protein phosphatase PrpC